MSAPTAILPSRWDLFGILRSQFETPERNSTFLANSCGNNKLLYNYGVINKGSSRLFSKFANLKCDDFTTFHFETHGDGVGYYGGCFGTDNDEPNMENAAPFPAGIDSHPVLTYRIFTASKSGYRPVISGGSRPHVHLWLCLCVFGCVSLAWSIEEIRLRRESPQPTYIRQWGPRALSTGVALCGKCLSHGLLKPIINE